MQMKCKKCGICITVKDKSVWKIYKALKEQLITIKLFGCVSCKKRCERLIKKYKEELSYV